MNSKQGRYQSFSHNALLLMLKLFDATLPKRLRVVRHQGRRSLLPLLLIGLFAVCVFLPVVSFANPSEPNKLQQLNGILAALEDGYPAIKGEAFKRLSDYDPVFLRSHLQHPKDIAQKAAAIFRDKTQDAVNRKEALGALGVLGEATKPYLQELEDYLKELKEDEDYRKEGNENHEEIEYAVAGALGRLGAVAQPNVSRLLKDKHFLTRQYNVQASVLLDSLGSSAQQYAPEILNIVKGKTSQSPVLRSYAAEALGKLGADARGFLPELINVLEREKNRSNFNVYQKFSFLTQLRLAIADIGGAPYLSDVISLLQTDKVNLDQTDKVNLDWLFWQFWEKASETLVKQGKAVDPYIPDLVNVLKDETKNAAVRCSAALTLIKLGYLAQAKPYLSNIINLFKDKRYTYYGREIATVVMSVGEAAKPYIPDLIKLLEDKTLEYSSSDVALAFGNLGVAALPYIPKLIELFKEDGYTTPYNKAKHLASLSAARALKSLGMTVKPYGFEIASILRDQKRDRNQRLAAAEMLSNLGETAQGYIPAITALLQEDEAFMSSEDASKVIEALGKIQKLDLGQAIVAINRLYDADNPENYWLRFPIYLSSAGDEQVKTLLQWLGRPDPNAIPQQLTHEQGRKTLELFAEAWESSENLPLLGGGRLLKQQEELLNQQEKFLKIVEDSARVGVGCFNDNGKLYKGSVKELLEVTKKQEDLKQQQLIPSQEREGIRQQGFRGDLARQIVEVVKNKHVRWHPNDLPLLQGHATRLKAARFKTAALETVVQDLDAQRSRLDALSLSLGLIAICVAFALGRSARTGNGHED